MHDNDDQLTSDEDSPLSVPRSPELMHAGDTLLLVVDMQERLLEAQPASRRITWNCRRLIDAANLLEVQVAASEQVPEKLGPTAALLAERLPTSRAAKSAFSACVAPEVVTRLADSGRGRVLLCGIETHVCIAQTACDLLAGGFHVLIAADAVGSRNAIDHEIALRRLELSGALLTTTEAAMFEWCETSDRAQFRQISALAKEEMSSES